MAPLRRCNRCRRRADDGQTQADARPHQTWEFLFGVRHEHDEWILHPPVGRIGHMGNARKGIEPDVIRARVAPELTAGAPTQLRARTKVRLEALDRAPRGCEQLAHTVIALHILRLTAAIDLAQSMMQCLDQQASPPRVLSEIILEKGIAVYRPDIPQHFVQHARGAAGATLVAQLVEQQPHRLAEQLEHDLPIGERGVVVWDLAQPRRRLRLA